MMILFDWFQISLCKSRLANASLCFMCSFEFVSVSDRFIFYCFSLQTAKIVYRLSANYNQIVCLKILFIYWLFSVLHLLRFSQSTLVPSGASLSFRCLVDRTAYVRLVLRLIQTPTASLVKTKFIFLIWNKIGIFLLEQCNICVI